MAACGGAIHLKLLKQSAHIERDMEVEGILPMPIALYVFHSVAVRLQRLGDIEVQLILVRPAKDSELVLFSA